MKFAAIGECLLELSHLDQHRMSLNYAGDTYNTTYYVARLTSHSEISYVTALGRDPYSESMIKHFIDVGIDTSLCVQFDEELPGLYLIKTDTEGERSFYYYRKQSAATQLFEHPDCDERFKRLSQQDYLFLSGISVAILPPPSRHKLLEILHEAKQNGVKILFDNNYRPKLWTNKIEAVHWLEHFLPLIDWLFVTYEDEKALFEDTSIDETLDRYRQHDTPLIIIKDGAKPCLIASSEEVHEYPAQKVTSVVDTTGAGDAFNAGFITSYHDNCNIELAAKAGHQLAARVIQTPGAILTS